MKEKDPIDNLFARNLSSNHYDMRPEDWQNALRLIESQKRRKRRLAFWLFGSLVVFGLLTGYWFAFAGGKEPENITRHEAVVEDAFADDGKEGNREALKSQMSTQEQALVNDASKGVLHQLADPNDKLRGRKGAGTRQNISAVPGSYTQLRKQPDVVLDDPAKDAGIGFQFQENHKSVTDSKAIRSLPDRFITIDVSDTGIRLKKMNTSLSGPEIPFEPVVGIGLSIGTLFSIGSSELWQGIEAGLMTTYQFYEKWGLQLGVMYGQNHQIGGYSQLEYQSEYDFGSVTRTLGMYGDTRHYLEFPLALHYHISRWSVFAGVAPSYTLGVQGSVNEITLMPTLGTRSNKVQQVVQSLSEGWLPTGPYRKWNFRTTAGMRYQVNKGFFLQGSLGYQWKNDLSDDPESLMQSKPSPVSIGLGIQIMLEQ